MIPDVVIPVRQGGCIVDGCDRPRHVATGHCSTHHWRLKHHGSTDPELSRAERSGLECSIDGCNRPRYSGIRGWCKLHYDRWLRHGDPLTVLVAMGSGDDITVSGAHKRVVAAKGRAAEHVCVDCGETAAHWSYDHADPHEKQSDHGPFSADPDHYVARCVPCHKRFDLEHLEATRAS